MEKYGSKEHIERPIKWDNKEQLNILPIVLVLEDTERPLLGLSSEV